MPWVLRAMISAVSHRQRVTCAVGIHFSNATKILQNNTMPARGVKTDNDGRNELFEWFYRGRYIKIKIRSRKKIVRNRKDFSYPDCEGRTRANKYAIGYLLKPLSRWSSPLAAAEPCFIPPLAGQAYQTAGPERHILLFTTTIITIIYFKTAPKLLFLNVHSIYTKYINKLK